MKIKDYVSYFEPFLLFLVLFFPSMFVNNTMMASFFTSSAVMINYIAITIPQILLILYFFYIKKWHFIHNFVSSHILKIIILIILYTFLLVLIANLSSLILKIAGFMQNGAKINTLQQFIPFYLLISVITGYREELFFRAYLINFFENSTNKIFLSILISAFFSICHLYQGIGAIIITFLNSMFLCFIFFRHRNIHINAISHALYNFFVLLISVFSII